VFGPNLVPRVSLGAKLTQVLSLLLWLFSIFTTFCCGSHKLLLWCSHTFAVAFTTFCLGIHKLLLQHLQVFAVAFKPLEWLPDLYFGWFKNKFAHLKLKTVN